MKPQRGFTLIEILVVLAIAAVLAAAAYPNYAHSLVRVRRIEGQAALIEAMQQQEQYRARHGAYLAFSSAAPAAPEAGLRWWSGQTPASSAYELDAQACEGAAIADCIVLRARPGTQRVNGHAQDPGCGSLMLDSRGMQTSTGPAARCWP